MRAWLFGIARNVLYEHIRGRVRDGRAEPDFHESALVDLAPGVSTIAGNTAQTWIWGWLRSSWRRLAENPRKPNLLAV